jgi:hypothetical protein
MYPRAAIEGTFPNWFALRVRPIALPKDRKRIHAVLFNTTATHWRRFVRATAHSFGIRDFDRWNSAAS